MTKNPTPPPSYFKPFAFSRKRGVYMPKTTIEEDRFIGKDGGYCQRLERIGRRYLACLTLVVLIVQAIILYKQTNIMDKQREISEDTLPEMRKQADSAATSAAAEKSQAETSEETVNALRADVVASQISCSTSVFGPDTEMRLIFKNVGKSTADGFEYLAYAGNPSALIPSHTAPPSIAEIGAGETVPSDPVNPVALLKGDTATALRRLVNGDVPFEMWGDFKYVDSFGPRHGCFRFRFQPNTSCGFHIVTEQCGSH
jgi:hypothetical protein